MNPAPVGEAPAEIVLNRRLTSGIHMLRLRTAPGWGPALPGQFVQLQCPPDDLFGLRRPFSLSACRPSTDYTELEIVYGAVGCRTRALAAAPVGSKLPVLGPLGRPFTAVPGRKPVLVAGGRGLAPLLMLDDALSRTLPDGLILYGVRSADLAIPDVKSAYPIRAVTEDGSMGSSGTVIDLLDCLVRDGELDPAMIALYSCGPNAMLAALDRWALAASVPCQLSLETHFGCGFGICAGCAVPVRRSESDAGDDFGRYILACREGPVVDAGLVEWEGIHE